MANHFSALKRARQTERRTLRNRANTSRLRSALRDLREALTKGDKSAAGQAYLAARNGVAAAGEFQKILDHSGVVGNEPIGALAHLGLGRAYAFSGDSTKAKTAYQDFFALWKDADADVPILKKAKAEYAKLQ